MSDSTSSKQQPTVESIMAILNSVAVRLNTVSIELREVAARQKETEASITRFSEESSAKIAATGAEIERLGRKLRAEIEKQGRELRAEIEKQGRELRAEIKKSNEETDARIEKNNKDINAKIKDTRDLLDNLGQQIGFVGNQWGKIAEYLVRSDFSAILKQRFGIETTYHARSVYGTHAGDSWEIDVVAANGEVAVVGEVKVTMTVEAIDNFVDNNLRNFHLYVPDHRHKQVYGLIAFVKIDKGYEKEVLDRARDRGLLVVKAIGDSFELLTPASSTLRDYRVLQT